MRRARFTLPWHEIHFDFVRSGGPGGQNVNKVSTKVVGRWHVVGSRALNNAQKERLARTLRSHLNKHGELVVAYERERSQSQNKTRVIARLEELVAQGLRVPKKRIATRRTFASKERRLASKTKRSAIKKSRRQGLSE